MGTPKIPYRVWLLDPKCEHCGQKKTCRCRHKDSRLDPDPPCTGVHVSTLAGGDGLRCCRACSATRHANASIKFAASYAARAPKSIDAQQRAHDVNAAEQLKLSLAEYYVHQELCGTGARVYRNGWPDFLVEQNGAIEFVEVKTPTDIMRPEQIAMHEALRRHGLRVRTEIREVRKVR